MSAITSSREKPVFERKSAIARCRCMIAWLEQYEFSGLRSV
jgi:hypothetical protein